MSNFNGLQTAISNVSGVQLDNEYIYLSSTEYGEFNAWTVNTDYGNVNISTKSYDLYVRAFLAL